MGACFYPTTPWSAAKVATSGQEDANYIIMHVTRDHRLRNRFHISHDRSNIVRNVAPGCQAWYFSLLFSQLECDKVPKSQGSRVRCASVNHITLVSIVHCPNIMRVLSGKTCSPIICTLACNVILTNNLDWIYVLVQVHFMLFINN